MPIKNALLAASALLAVSVTAPVGAAHAADVILGLVDGSTVVTINPESREVIESVTVDSNPLVGFDFRPSNGKLYGVTDAQEIVTIDYKTGKTTPVAKISGDIETNRVTVVDFNPVLDKIRIVDSNNGSHRIDVETGENTIDGILFFNQHDGSAEKTPRILAGSYTNSVKAQITTELYNIDATTNSLVLQNPPNAGMVTTMRKLDIDLGSTVAFNIVHHEGNHQAWLATNNELYELDIKTGKTKSLGEINGLEGTLTDIAWVYPEN